jgi:hypothetical protein
MKIKSWSSPGKMVGTKYNNRSAKDATDRNEEVEGEKREMCMPKDIKN